MNLKKFMAATSREAMRKVREALGPEAVILSNRNVGGGVEIVALASDELETLVGPSRSTVGSNASAAMRDAQSLAMLSERTESQASLQQHAVPAAFARRHAESRDAEIRPAALPPSWVQQPDDSVQLSPAAKRAAAGMERAAASPVARDDAQAEQISAKAAAKPAAKVALKPAVKSAVKAEQASELELSAGAAISDVMDEIRSMRGMLESQLTELTWGAQQKREPAKALIMREMLSAGFSASLARYLSERVPADISKLAGNDGMAWLRSVLLRNLAAQVNEDVIVEQGGVYALVGPTGVGKTTTTAKLAARCVVRHGAGSLALITTDGYRIGGYEQLRIYGKILGVMVHSVKDEADLRIALAELKNKHTILIDTAGAGQRDQMVAEQVAMLQGTGQPLKRLLCLPATSTGETLNEVVRAYRGDGLAGCILTKLDEAATIGNVLDIIIRQKLALYYIANGQRVPEDLHLARPQYLIDRAFKPRRESAAFQLLDDELPALVASTPTARNDRSLCEVSLG